MTDPGGTHFIGDAWDAAKGAAESVYDTGQNFINKTISAGRSRLGRCAIGATIYGSAAAITVKDPRVTTGAALVGCGAGVANKGF